MSSAKIVRRWSWVHRWSSLVCTVFMLLTCITGLPLIFHQEIEAWAHPASDMASQSQPLASLDAVEAAARSAHNGKVVQYISRHDSGAWQVMLGDSPRDESGVVQALVDPVSARVMDASRPDEGFMAWMLALHVELMVGLPGTLFLGGMGLLLLVAIVSGVVLYAPFARKLGFGAVRHEASTRARWLDLHNLLGIVTLAWLGVVALTGVINTLGEPVLAAWRTGQLAELAQMAQKGQAGQAASPTSTTAPSVPASLQSVVSAAERQAPGMRLGFIAYPGTAFSSEWHHAVFMRGTTPLTNRLYQPVLVDAASANAAPTLPLPWTVLAVMVSQPLHFGDYGGLPLKIIWALLDVVAIIVLASGLYLWWARRGDAAQLR